MNFSTTDMSFEDIKQAWLKRHPRRSREEYQFADTLLRLLSEGNPVSAQRYAQEANLPIEQVQEDFKQIQVHGAEVDDNGDLIGNALTLKPTRHHFNVNGTQLYAWCSLDTLFLPSIIGKIAQVESTDPITGEAISLTVSPNGVSNVTPETAVSSIVVPDMTANCESCVPNQTGPESAVCSQMFYFASRESANQWLLDHSDVAVLTVQEAFELAKYVWLEPRSQATDEVSTETNHNQDCGANCCT